MEKNRCKFLVFPQYAPKNSSKKTRSHIHSQKYQFQYLNFIWWKLRLKLQNFEKLRFEKQIEEINVLFIKTNCTALKLKRKFLWKQKIGLSMLRATKKLHQMKRFPYRNLWTQVYSIATPQKSYYLSIINLNDYKWQSVFRN